MQERVKSVAWSRVVALSLLLVCVAACSGSPTTPAPPRPPLDVVGVDALVMPVCRPDGQDVVCRAFVVTAANSTTEVTASARWAAVPSDVAAVVAPGRFRPLRSGELAVNAQVDGAEPLEQPLKFLVEPNRTARSMVTLWITVREQPNASIDGATVKVLDGYRAGTECTTFLGVCLVTYVPAGDTPTLHVAKNGYQAATVRHEIAESVVPISYVTVTLARE